jgi:glycosyltransferase involved in cell wall biosynthesis
MMDERTTVLYGIGQLSIGGAERQLFELARRLDRARYRPLVCSLTMGGAYTNLLTRAGIPVYEFARRSPFDPVPVLAISRLIRSQEVSILHTFGFYGGLYGRLAAAMARPRIVISSERATRAWKRHLRSPLYFGIERTLACVTDAFIANAMAVRDFAVREKGLDPTSVHVIYNGIDPGRFEAVPQVRIEGLRRSLGIRPEDKVVGIVARLDPMKDHHTFILSAERVIAELPTVRFVIVGDGPLRSELELTCRTRKLADRVVFTGERHGQELNDLMAMMDALVSSSKEGEGCSNALLEAMVLGKPVVATTVGGNPELLADGETGLLVAPEDSRQLAAAVGSLLTNEPMRHRMGQAARRRALTEFSVDKMVEQTTLLYRRLGGLARRRQVSRRSPVP